MSIQLQLALPLFVAAAALVLIAILRKYRKPEPVILCLAMVILGVFALTAPAITLGEAPQQVAEITETEASSLVLAQYYIRGGEYKEAEKILQDLQQVNAEDPDIQLTMARCKLLQGDYAAAVHAYNSLGKRVNVAEEGELARNLYMTTVPNSNALITQLKQQGKDPAAYGLTEAVLPKVSLSDAKYLVEKEIDKVIADYEEKYGNAVNNAAKRALAISEEFTRYNAEGSYDSSKLGTGVKALENELTENAGLKQNRHLRLALLKGYVLRKDYKKIAAMVDENACSEELIIATDLYISGDIGPEDFSEAYLNSNQEQGKQVLNTCEDALEAIKESLSKEDYTAYQKKVNNLRAQMADPAVHNLKQQLMEAAQHGDPGMRSKNYLALARLEQSCGDDNQADAFITDALGSATISDDAEYREPMVNMLQVVQGSSDSSDVKNVAAYAQQAMDNALPLDLESVGDTTKKDEFTQELGQSVNESTAKLNIGKIDISQFPTVTARVQILSNKWSTLSQLQQNLQVYDCGGGITSFRLEKMEFKKSRIILLCDVSGSMSGSVDDMKNAIVKFSEGMQPGEEVCVIGFDSSIQFVHDFSGDPKVVAGYADSMYAGGGTALYTSLLGCEQYLSSGEDCNNIIIAMTDGQDGSAANEATMRTEIGRMVNNTNATVYTLGLGDVDTDYLREMAENGNGSFLYAESQEKLAAFYDFIHGQLRNQYILTFTAENQTLNERQLKLSLNEEMCTAQKTYYLREPENPDSTIDDSDETYVATNVERKVHGLSIRSLARTNVEQNAYLAGEAFKSEDKITVTLKGVLTFKLEAKYVSDKLYEVTIPADIGIDTYTLEVSVGGDFFTMENELTVYEPDDIAKYPIGNYIFRGYASRTEEDGTVVLSGDVTMNDWLRFNGEVKFKDNGETVTVTDMYGAYVPFSAGSTGLAKAMAESYVPLCLGCLGDVKLSKHAYDVEEKEDFPIDKALLLGIVDANIMTCNGVSISVYPDMLEFKDFEMDLELPLLDQLFSSLDEEEAPFEADGTVVINGCAIGITGELKYQNEAAEKNVKVGKLPIQVEETVIKVDTLHDNYDFELKLRFKKFLGMEGVGGKIQYRGGRFSGFEVNANVDIPIVKAPVPVSFSSLGILASGFEKDSSDDELLEEFLNKTIGVTFALNVADVTDLLPELADFLNLKDMPLLALEGGRMEVTFKDFKWELSAKASFLGEIDVGEVTIAIGNYDYECELLGIYNAENCGMMADLKSEIKLESGDLMLKVGAGGKLDIGAPYTSVGAKSGGELEWGWIEEDFNAEAVVALFKNSSGDLQFSLKIRHLFGVDIVSGEWPKFQFGKKVGK